MSENEIIQPQAPQSFEDWLKNLIYKIRPYTHRLWENKFKFLVVNFIVGAVYLLYLLFLTKPFYESTITILPEFGGKASSLANLTQLATLAGVRVGESVPTEIYQDLIKSEAVLEPVIMANFKTEKFRDSVNLVQYFITSDDKEKLDGNPRKLFLRAYDILAKRLIRSNLDRFTRILTITVTASESKLSADIANEIAESLDEYIRTKRRSYATEQRFYIEKRSRQILDSLSLIEDSLKRFNEQNRIVFQSPQLLLERGRLMRAAEILNSVYIELNRQMEIAKIDEIRETPVVNVKEVAKDPIYKAGPARLNSFITLMIFSVLISAFYFIFQNQIKKYLKLLTGKQS